MKKTIIFSIALSALFLVSCKKDWTCTCKDATGGEVRKFTKVTKTQAQANCQTVQHTEAGATSNEVCTLSK
jgi:PBP1b-binding outer membrane lipoprotein LpoB